MADTPVTGPVETTEFEISIETSEGERVVVNVKFPKDRALIAIQALAKFGEPEYITGLLGVNRDDPSVAAKLAEMHLGFDDDEDDW